MPVIRPVHEDAEVRIGTWNLAGRWDDRHEALLASMACDVLLLTEVSDRIDLRDLSLHRTEAEMARRRRWAGVWSRRPVTPLPDPHGATAMVEIAGLKFCSSVLPWRSCGARAPWIGANTEERTREAVEAIVDAKPDVWGGDFNHALTGREYAGSVGGRRDILEALAQLDLVAPTVTAPHQLEGLHSIDHVAVPRAWKATVEHFSALTADGRLSDHDAYALEIK